MTKQKKIGVCHICGENGPLTYEHVPPEAAFNDSRVIEADIMKLMGADNLLEHLENPKGKYKQRGSGKHTLCDMCNTRTGDWYARDYVAFARQAYPACQSASVGTTIIFKCKIRPLNVFKQLLVMFCSVSPPSFAQKHPSLVRYLLNPESRNFEEKFRVCIAFFDVHGSHATRQSGITGRMTIGEPSHVYSEISFPPFNIILALDGNSPDNRLFDITYFSNFDFRQSAELTLSLNSLPVNTYFPADYRTIDELQAAVAENRGGGDALLE